jgi:prepilin-type processing-associated H-X9-DG protein
LLVVVAIIALLLSILLPSLNGARKAARAAKCAANLHGVGQAFAQYLSENRGYFPVSYAYPASGDGDVDFHNQDPSHPNGYVHWSWFLFSRGEVKKEAFTCPEIAKGGLPRTNPGKNPADWEGGQVDQDGGRAGGSARLEDKQAPRMAYTANAAIIGRNKFTRALAAVEGNGDILNKWVSDGEIRSPRPIVLVTEFNANWKLAAKPMGGAYLVKSHRPVNPFWNIGSGYNPYGATPNGPPQFRYSDTTARDFGLEPASALEESGDVFANKAEVNIVGRHHSGKGKYGGTTNFLYVDGSVQRKDVLQTLLLREWGSAFYSLKGTSTELLGFERD